MPLSSLPASPEQLSHDGATGSFGVGQHDVNLLWRTDVVSEFDAGSAVTAKSSPKTISV